MVNDIFCVNKVKTKLFLNKQLVKLFVVKKTELQFYLV